MFNVWVLGVAGVFTVAMCRTHAVLAAGVYGRRPAKFGELTAGTAQKMTGHQKTLVCLSMGNRPTTQPNQPTSRHGHCESWLILWVTRLLTWQALRRVWDVLLVDGIEAIRCPSYRKCWGELGSATFYRGNMWESS